MKMVNKPLRIGSYNIRKARGLDQKTDPRRILQVIRDLDADIVVLQEADKRLGRRDPAVPRELIAQNTDYRLVEVSENGTSLGHHGNAVLVRGDLTPARVQRIDLPGLEPRGAVCVDFAVAHPFSVVATHLGLLRRHRTAQLHVIDTQTQDREQIIIAGDMNEWSQHMGLDPLQKRFNILSPGHSFHASRPIAALDRFAMSKQIHLHNAGVDQSALARRASDHLPIWCDISVMAPR